MAEKTYYHYTSRGDGIEPSPPPIAAGGTTAKEAVLADAESLRRTSGRIVIVWHRPNLVYHPWKILKILR